MCELVVSKTIAYLDVPAVVGHEQFFMDVLERDFKELGLSVYRQEGYIAVSGADPLSAFICAHVDRHGLISLGDDEYVYAAQYMKEIKYGENNRLAQQQLESIARRFEGEKVFAYDGNTGEHLGEGVIEACNPRMLDGDALFFVQGMPAMESAVPLAYARTARYEGGYLKGQIDNAISLGAVYALFRQGFAGTAILSTEEEIGKSWPHIKAYLELEKVKTAHLLVLDTSPYTEKETIEKGDVIFRSRDMSAEFNHAFLEQLKERAGAVGVSFQVKDEVMRATGKTVEQLGSTELGKLVKNTEGKWNGATVQIPTLMYHTSNETTTQKAIENYCAFLRNILIDDPLPALRVKRGGRK